MSGDLELPGLDGSDGHGGLSLALIQAPGNGRGASAKRSLLDFTSRSPWARTFPSRAPGADFRPAGYPAGGVCPNWIKS